jgi:excinuclease ABC subunit B
LYLDEFVNVTSNKVCMSATPGDYELKRSGRLVEQIVRPTGLVDPEMEVRPATGQVDDLVGEIEDTVKAGGRVLVTTLTKRMAEELTEYLCNLDLRAKYVHSEIDALERVSILRELRLAEFDVLVGVNLLREGLDLPEVELVTILDADKEGFLRSRTSIVQTAGRAARNLAGKVVLYADRVTGAMRSAIGETRRRRKIQMEYNRKHGVVPRSVSKTREEVLRSTSIADVFGRSRTGNVEDLHLPSEPGKAAIVLERRMLEAAEALDFETAAAYRDRLRRILSDYG